jgi:hypothetical protein
MRKSFLVCLSTLICLSTVISPVGIASARMRCGKDYTAIPLPDLVRIYRKSYVAAGFKVISQDVKDINATLRIRFLKKGAKFHQDLEYKFAAVPGGAINACGSIYDSRELSDDSSEVAERHAYMRTFSKIDQAANNKIKKEISDRK